MGTASSNLHLFYGTDEYGVSEKARACVDRLCPPDQRALGLDVIDARVGNASEAVAAVKACLEALRTPGFLTESKVVWLRGANFLGGSPVGTAELTKTWVAYLVDLLKAGLPDSVVFVLSTDKINKSTSLFKRFKAQGSVEEYQISDKSWQATKEARGYVAGWFREAGRAVEDRALDRLVDRVGADRRRLASEAEKLCLYAYGADLITAVDVDEVVSAGRETLIWDLTDALGRRDPVQALRVLDALAEQGESAVGAIINLERTVALMMILRDCHDRGWVSLEKGYGNKIDCAWNPSPEGEALLSEPFPDPRSMHPYRAAMALENAIRFSSRELSAWQTRIVRAHEKLVTTAVPPFLVLQQLMFELMPLRRRP